MSDLRLEYADLWVGSIRGAFRSDGTWFGTVAIALDRSTNAMHGRVLDHVAFCEEWNERARRPNAAAEAAEFIRFPDIVASGRWRTRASDGRVSVIVNAPVFFRGDEISWQTE